MKTKTATPGVWPVMLTPFDDRREIDWHSLERLIDWYIRAGVQGLFANCQSSEMFYLSESESQRLTRFVLNHVDGRVPVIASGHTACGLSQQIDQLSWMAESGVDGVILISNRLAMPGEDDQAVLETLQSLTRALPSETPLGIYECPHPYKRLLSDAAIDWCAKSGRFSFIKDTSCRIDIIRRRLELIAGSPLRLANANGRTLLASLQAGAHGYSGIMTNFHPDLYVWLCRHWHEQPEQARQLADYLGISSLVEHLDYPVCAKAYQVSLGNLHSIASRARDTSNYFATHYPLSVEQMLRMGDEFRRRLGIASAVGN